jgi:hypothetical protein
MTCLICQQPPSPMYVLVGIEEGTWKSVYACAGPCAQAAREQYGKSRVRPARPQRAEMSTREQGGPA